MLFCVVFAIGWFNTIMNVGDAFIDIFQQRDQGDFEKFNQVIDEHFGKSGSLGNYVTEMFRYSFDSTIETFLMLIAVVYVVLVLTGIAAHAGLLLVGLSVDSALLARNVWRVNATFVCILAGNLLLTVFENGLPP